MRVRAGKGVKKLKGSFRALVNVLKEPFRPPVSERCGDASHVQGYF
jgi:hypothetical protein